ncbi:polyketide cyclase / dehydrase and lipid transport [Mycobacterium kyorinense]|uniref:Polyketide cyclase / dehydrase and lipid transport n=1 Tax=Mycobacterium kyorinense TaxID=487514 RepID=A0A1X1YG13_9MYCO|nr:polyketide cyclase / dehydrase and lipid transport [Mycobacterium kyorinense]ORW09994.1 polyketide cyclase / dehydrase and lipid transport [Mycobacterium kyorinense]
MSWWITQLERTLTEEVPATPDDVRDFYVGLDNIKAVHPLVVSVRTLSRTRTADGYQQTYRVVDRIPLGILNLRVSYWARLHVPTQGDVITEARQFPRVRLSGRVSFDPSAVGTLVTERLRIAAPRPLAGITEHEAVDAHLAMLSGIRDWFQSRA